MNPCQFLVELESERVYDYARVADSTVTGKGLFATKDLVRGELIVREPPAISIGILPPNTHLTNTQIWTAAHSMQRFPLLAEMSANMTASVIENSFQNVFTPTTYRRHAITTSMTHVVEGQRFRRDMHSLFVLSSFINHSCTPNAIYMWKHAEHVDDVGKLYLRALAPISEGEEIFVSYLQGPHGTWEPKSVRHAQLDAIGISNCTCAVCESPKDERVRQYLTNIHRKAMEMSWHLTHSIEDPSVLVTTDLLWRYCLHHMEVVRVMFRSLDGFGQLTEIDPHLHRLPLRLSPQYAFAIEWTAQQYCRLYRSLRIHDYPKQPASRFEKMVYDTTCRLFALATEADLGCFGSILENVRLREDQRRVFLRNAAGLEGKLIQPAEGDVAASSPTLAATAAIHEFVYDNNLDV